MILGLALLVTGCDEPDDSDGVVVDAIVLPTDTLLNLACADVGIFTETCVLDDPENPYVNAVINEFDQNNPDAETKF
ncbi:MAG: hypothetical protein R3282_08600, partial [Rhodothermales bacterium]|nr:hypothetical protein [Rhodothermales bacterium]